MDNEYRNHNIVPEPTENYYLVCEFMRIPPFKPLDGQINNVY